MDKSETWAAFGSKYIKAVDVLNDTDKYAIVGVSSKEETQNGITKEVLHLTISRNETEKLFGCNATNSYTVQCECPNSPKDAIGRVITFNKVQVSKPGTNPPEIVDGLRLVFVKETEPEHEFGVDEKGEM